MPNPPDMYSYELFNNNGADTIYPIIYDHNGSIIWNGKSDAANNVPHNSQKTYDLSQIIGGPKSQTVIILGCGVVDTDKTFLDSSQLRTYIYGSVNTAVGQYQKDGTFAVDAPKSFGLDAAALQGAYVNLASPAVAKLLVSLANLISPELI